MTLKKKLESITPLLELVADLARVRAGRDHDAHAAAAGAVERLEGRVDEPERAAEQADRDAAARPRQRPPAPWAARAAACVRRMVGRGGAVTWVERGAAGRRGA